MSLCRRVGPSPEIEAEANRLANEWLEMDTPLSLDDYVYQNGSKKLKLYCDMMDGVEDEGLYRLAGVPPELQEEFNRLLDEWAALDEDIEVEDYFKEHGSDKMKAYLEERDRVENEEM